MDSRIQIAVFAFCAVFLLAGGKSPRETSPPKLHFTVEQFEFGTFDSQGRFFATTDIRISNSDTYGWRMKIRTDRSHVEWKEVMRLPSPAQQWGVGPSTKVSASGQTATTTQQAWADNGVAIVEQFWGYAKGDPFGTYTSTVYVNDSRVRIVHFTVRP